MSFRSPTFVELAVLIAVGGSTFAVMIPSFFHNLHASRLSEAIHGVQAIGSGAVAYALNKDMLEAFPPSAPLTPADVPRGRRMVDLPGSWDHLTWAALGFSMSDEHYFSFSFESKNSAEFSFFLARAHGDLDGDGERSTFELRGEMRDAHGPRLLPGLFIDREIE